VLLVEEATQNVMAAKLTRLTYK